MMKTPKEAVRVRLMKPESAKAPKRRVECPACGATVVIESRRRASNCQEGGIENATIGEAPGIFFDEGPYGPCLLRKTRAGEVWGFRPISTLRRRR
jgi:hypothetical protein